MRELSKPKVDAEPHRKSKRLSLLIRRPATNTRNLSLVVSILKKYPDFNQFVAFNDIDHSSLEKMANYLDIKHVKKSQYLYREGDKPDFFYILVKGKLSIKKWVRKRSIDKAFSLIEEETIVAEPGYAFNERHFINRDGRTNSCYAVEDCVLLYIDEEAFKLTIMKSLVSNEAEKKSFLLKSFINIPGLNHQLYEGLYNNISTRLVRPNEFLIKENETGNKIFIVFQNELVVSKYILTNHKCINHPLCKVSKGALLGLEVLFGKENYSYSFKGSHQQDEIAYIFEFDLSPINDPMMKKLKEVHANFYVKFKEAMDKLYISKLQHEKSNSLSYPNISLDLFSNEELVNRQLEKSYLKIIEDQRSQKEQEGRKKVILSKIAIYSLPKLRQKKLFGSIKTKGANSSMKTLSILTSIPKKNRLTQPNHLSLFDSMLHNSKSSNTKITNGNDKAGKTRLNNSQSVINQHHHFTAEHSNGHSFFSMMVTPKMKDSMADFAQSTVNLKHKFNSGVFKMPLIAGGQ